MIQLSLRCRIWSHRFIEQAFVRPDGEFLICSRCAVMYQIAEAAPPDVEPSRIHAVP